MNPVYLKNNQIDRQKWDRCLVRSFNAMPYAYSWYLDAVLGARWEALIDQQDGRYSAVLPLHIRKSWGRRYVLQNPYIMDVDVYTNSPEERDYFFGYCIDFLHHRFDYIGKMVVDPFTSRQFDSRMSLEEEKYFVDLALDYPALSANYHSQKRKVLRKSYLKNQHITISENIEKLFLNFEKFVLPKSQIIYPPNAFRKVRALYTEMIKRGHAFIFEASLEGKTTGMLSVVVGANRILSDYSFTTSLGRTNNTATLLTDYVIKKYAGSSKILDFNTADNEGLKYYKENFGCKKVAKKVVRVNKLPGPVKFALSLRRNFIRLKTNSQNE